MNIVIVGAHNRISSDDRKLVSDLIDGLAEKYSSCLFVTTAHSEGVGKYVREKCLERNVRNEYKYQLAVVNVQLFVSKRSREEVAAIYQTRNATLLELGDVYYYLASDSRTGMMETLINSAEALGRPVKVLLPGDPLEL